MFSVHYIVLIIMSLCIRCYVVVLQKLVAPDGAQEQINGGIQDQRNGVCVCVCLCVYIWLSL